MDLSSKDPILFRSLILDNYENPKYLKQDSEIKGYLFFNNNSESCIDNLTVYIKFNNNYIEDVFFKGVGCAISTASTNILCDELINKSINDAVKILSNYTNMIEQKEYDEKIINKLIIFCNVNKQLNRIRCARIGSDAFINIIKEHLNEK